jgi:hypothetical protein
MKKKPTCEKDLQSHGEECDAILKFLKKYWNGLDNVKPKGYDEFCKNYCDFDGINEWEEKEKKQQEDYFDGFDNSDDGFNFVRLLSLSQIVYDDLCQERSPIYSFISACVSYGFTRGYIYGVEKGEKKENVRLMNHILNS